MTQIGHMIHGGLTVRPGGYNTDALSLDFQSLHEQIIDTDSVNRTLDQFLDKTSLLHFNSGFLRNLYESIISCEIRLQLWEYYTPRGVAELAVDELKIRDHKSDIFLDPRCGTGIFLATAINEKRGTLEDELAPRALVDVITETVYGIDLNSVAVQSAKLCYFLSLLPLIAGDIIKTEIPVFLIDPLRLTKDDNLRFGGGEISLEVDHLVGNSTRITWGNLSEFREKQLVDGAPWLQAACHRHEPRFQHEIHENRNSVERVVREVKRQTNRFANCFSHAEAKTVENW